ncbi:unnamed protein product [Clonostachys byssicola]|uniref:Uncharacterized protein n=1 Tax=Clonostachys byssicola TaxID=160290 RepID=A0A9N9UWR3_9HYPO|nr:unnamed protein product [Clonostachys byssicola]
MNNPDWRQRGSQTGSDESSYPDLAAKKAPRREGLVKRDSAENRMQLFPSDASFLNTLNADPSQPRPRNWHPSSTGTEDGTNSNEMGDRALGAIKSNQAIDNGGKEWGMSIIEIVPFCGGGGQPATQGRSNATYSTASNMNNVVEIRHMGTHKARKDISFPFVGQDQHEQLAAALRGAGETPKKMKRPETFSSIYEDSTAENTTRSSSVEIILSGSPTTNTNLLKQKPSLSASRESENKVSLLSHERGRHIERGLANDGASDAFGRMLQRLHKNMNKGQTSQGIEMKDFQPEKSSKWNGHLSSRTRGDSSSSSGSIFNPRAREFFSLVAGTSADAESIQPKKPVRPDLQGYFNPSPIVPPLETVHNKGYGQDNLSLPIQSGLPFAMFDPGATLGDMPLPTLHSQFPEQPMAKPIPQLYTNPAMTWSTPNLAPAQHVGPMPVGMSNGAWSGTLPVPPMFPGMMPALAGPPMEPMHPTLGSTTSFQKSVTMHPMNPPQGSQFPANAPAQRHPVPKPRVPDPGNQQAYEAWIEWRKANEPGYAIECKLRQQRRAQRNMGSKPHAQASRSLEVKSTA